MIRKAIPLLALLLAGGCSSAPAQPTLVPEAEPTDAPPESTAGSADPSPGSTAAEGAAEDGAPPDVDGPPAASTTTPSGLSYLVLTKGDGTEKPREESKVLIRYTGWTTDGRMFDATGDDGPIRLRVDALVTGLIEGLQLMVEGDRFRFWLPTPLAYGDTPRPDQPKGMLVFEVELLEIH